MDRIIYVIRVYGQGKTMVTSFGTEIPSHLNRPGFFDQASDSELKAMFKTLFLKHWDSLLAEQGPVHCTICEKPVTLIKNWPLRDRGKIIDSVFPVCGHGKCEILATQQRTDTVAQVSQQETCMGDDSNVKHSCCVCHSTSRTLKCGRCQLTPYCSRECQKACVLGDCNEAC